MYKHTLRLMLFAFLLFTAITCKKKDEEIPMVAVSFDVSLNDPQAVDLNAIGGWIYVTGGVQGIIIFRKTQDEYLAFERNCSFKPTGECARVNVEKSNVSAKDDCCGSTFSLVDGGNVTHGPAEHPLKQYATTLRGSVLHVQN